MTTMPDVITAPQAERHNRRRKGYPLPGSYWDRVQRGPRKPARRSRKSPPHARGLARTMSARRFPGTSGQAAWKSATGRVRLGIGSGIAQRIARLGTRYRPLAALTDAVQIVRGLLRHETVTYRGRAFSADRVALEFAAPRPDMPIHLAAMADRSLALCGRLADGLIVSNLCPPAYTARAVGIVRESAAAAGRESFDIVQYLPCAARPDGAEAREIAKEAVGTMLIALWPTGNDWPAQRETIVRLSGIARPEMVGALDRLRRGERAGRVLDDRFISGFALAGTEVGTPQTGRIASMMRS